MMSLRKMMCSCFLVVTLFLGIILPFSIFPTTVLANAMLGSSLAGVKGYSFEVAAIASSQWTNMVVDIKDGNLMVLAKPLEIAGSGKSLTFEMTYNSVNHDLDLGLGKGWTCNLLEMVYEDSTTHDVTYINKTGAKMIFSWNSTLSSYISPKGFEGFLSKLTNGGYEITDWNYLSTTFDGSGKLIKYSCLAIDLLTIQYNSSGLPVSITDAISARTITLTWSQSHITEVKDTMNQTWKLNYSTAFTQLLSLEKPDLSKTEFSYDSNHYLLTHKDFKAQTYTISYVTSGAHIGKIASMTLPSSSVYEFSYDTNVSGYSSKTQILDPENLATAYFFGSTTQHLEKISRISGTNELKTTYTYDSFGFIVTKGDSYNQLITYTRDSNHQITDVTYPPATVGGVPFQVQYTYLTAFPSLKSQKMEKVNATPVWAITSYEYTDMDCPVKPSKVTDPLGTETIYDYNTNHQIVSVTSGTGPFSATDVKTRTYSYTVNGNLATMIDAEGNETTYSLNACGFIESQIKFEGSAMNGQITEQIAYTYDSSNQPTKISNQISNLEATKRSRDKLNLFWWLLQC
jgi:YD repeat-containing protein